MALLRIRKYQGVLPMRLNKKPPVNLCRTCALQRIRTFDSLIAAQRQVRPEQIPKNSDTTGESPNGITMLQAQCPTGLFWTVGPGDTFFGIARTTGTTVQRITALNPGIDPEALQIGMSVCLPEEAALPRGPIPPCPSGLYWVISQGDTLFTIARAYGTTVERLLELNPGIDPLNLQIGMSVCLPG
jgi:spore germination protein YaaH